MSDLVAFLRARYDVAEARARAADGNSWSFAVLQGTYSVVSDGYLAAEALDVGSTAIVAQGRTVDASQRMMHIALNDPAYVLADIAAKRQIVDRAALYGRWAQNEDTPAFKALATAGDLMVRLLATPFASHPDYDPAWAVDTS